MVISLVHDDLASQDKRACPPVQLTPGAFKGTAACGAYHPLTPLSPCAVGTSVYFWSLKSTRANKARVQHEALTAEAAALTAQVAKLEEAAAAARASRPAGDDHAEAAAQFAAAKARHAALSEELTARAGSDPVVWAAVQSLPAMGIAAANRWTDNIFMLTDWMQRKKGVPKDQVADFLRVQTGLKLAELDYVTLEGVQAGLQPKASKAKAPGASGAKKRKAVAVPEEAVGEE